MKRLLIISMTLAGTLSLSACGGGAGGALDPVGANPTQALDGAAALTLSTAAASATRVTLNWKGPAGTGNSYQIYRNGQLDNSASNSQGLVVDRGLTPGTQYCYQVTAVNSAGAGTASSNKSCTTTAGLAGWNMEQIPEAPPVSLALDPSGLERLSFCNPWNGVVYQARQADGSWNSTVVDPAATCFNTRLAVGGDGSAYLIYLDNGSNTLKYATNVGGAWNVSQIPGTAGAEFYVMALDSADHVHLAYQLFTGQASDCHHIIYASNASGTWESQLVAHGDVYPAIAVDGTGMARIAFLGAQSADGTYPVHYLSDVSGVWTDAVVATSSDPKSLAALAVDGAGHAHIAYKTEADLDYASDSSGSWRSAKVDIFLAGIDSGSYGDYDVSLALDSSGQPHVSYEDNSGNLKYGSSSSQGWGSVYVDTEGTQNQLSMDAAGHAHITYAYTDNLYSKLAVSP